MVYTQYKQTDTKQDNIQKMGEHEIIYFVYFMKGVCMKSKKVAKVYCSEGMKNIIWKGLQWSLYNININTYI